MARTTPQVDGDKLVFATNSEIPITLDTPAWFAWLENVTTFAFKSSFGNFIARKEARSRGGWYWKAYYTANNTLHRAYLGKTADLTLDCLTRAAVKLVATAAIRSDQDPVAPPVHQSTLPVPAPRTIPLVATKLIAPPARTHLVSRPRLFERVEAGLKGNLTLIAAPAGFGKTTLLSAWRAMATGSTIPFGWVSLDDGDNDPLLFWSYFLTAIETVTGGAITPALSLLQSPQPPPVELILTTMLNGLTAHQGSNAVLVLEDYHVITNPAIHQALAWLLDCLPDTLHLVIITRADPPLPLARLRVRGELAELHADDLRFTPDEITDFLNQIMGLALTSAELVALEERTEGWIAGLQLAALALRGHQDRTGFIRSFGGSNRYIVDYLVAEVFERQPVPVQSFLLATSILDRMCGSLCNALLDLTDASAQSMLEELERANLFVVPLDDHRQWYRYHHLFAAVLRQRLARNLSGSERDALHERASNWYEQQGLITEAIQHALLQADSSRAAELIEQYGLNIIVGGQVQTVLGWLKQLPSDLLLTHPRLCIYYSLALLFTNDLNGAEARLQDAERSIGADTPPAEAQLTQGNAAAIRANMAVYTGDLAACAAYGEQVLRLLPETEVIARTMARLHVARAFRVTGDVTATAERLAIAAIAPIRATGNLLGTLGAVINLARLQELQGRLRLAATTYGELVQIATGPEELRGLHGGLPYYVGMGDLYREWNNLDAASSYLAQAMELNPGTGTADAGYVTLGYLAQARLQHARGEHALARETVTTFLDLAHRRGFVPHLIRRALAVQAQLALADGNLSAAIAWSEASGLQADADLSYPREVEYLVLARVWIARSSSDEYLTQAFHLLDRLMADAKGKNRRSSELEILIVRALALAAQGNRSSAQTALVNALELAAPEGYIRRFVDEGPAMKVLLQSLAAVAGPTDYIRQLLAAFESEPGTEAGTRRPGSGEFKPTLSTGSTSANTGSHPVLPEPITERELAVLRLIATGQSNAEIAKALVIALSTVKTHTNSIFSKLGVASRTQAVALARELQLL